MTTLIHPAPSHTRSLDYPVDVRQSVHDLPIEWNGESLPARTQTTFYLPPLLSSLPDSLSSAPPELSPSSSSSSSAAIVTNMFAPLKSDERLPKGTVDPASLSLHKALHGFHPLGTDYAELAYGEAFNWKDLRLDVDAEREWYCVVFRSKRSARNGDIDRMLYEADARAHSEAIKHGGLLMYWYGVPDPVSGINLATCIWQSRRHALAAIGGPEHVKAMRLAATSYELYALERHVLVKRKEEVRVSVRRWEGGEVGW